MFPLRLALPFLYLCAAPIVIAQDSDNDGASDSFEIATGFDPEGDSSTPPPFQAIGINFYDGRSDTVSDGLWTVDEANGYIPQAYWNHAETTTGSSSLANITAPVVGQIVDAQGNPSPLSFTVSYRFSDNNELRGSQPEKLYNGYARARDEPVDLTVTNVPYASYDVYVYLAGERLLSIGKVTLNKDSASPDSRVVRPYLNTPEFSFVPERRTLGLTPDRLNVLRFQNLDTPDFSIEVTRVFSTCGIAAIQIVNRTPDADGDSIPDWWELLHKTDASLSNALADPDGDTLDNLGEFNRQTDPNNPDSDSDGLSDKVETNTNIYASLSDTGTDPNFADSDEDTIADYDELNHLNPSDPNKADTDDDGRDDVFERSNGTSARDGDISDLPLPQISTSTNFSFEIPNTQILWNHDRGWITPSATRFRDSLLRAGVQNSTSDSSSFYSPDIFIELKTIEGKLFPRFYTDNSGAFSRPGSNFFQVTGSEDLTAACGFSGVGARDISDLLTFSIVAQKSGDRWSVTHSILNQRSGQTVYTHTRDGLEAHSTINSGTAVWRNKNDSAEVARFDKDHRSEILITSTAANTIPALLPGVDANDDGITDTWAADFSITDAGADPDGDGLSNYAEFIAGTNPTKKDSDDDGADDALELFSFTDPGDPGSTPYYAQSTAPTGGDFNNNMLSDVWEGRFSAGRILSFNADPDGDGFTNREEDLAGTNPLDSNSFLSLNVANAGNNLRLTWSPAPNKSTRIFSSLDLSTFNPVPGTASSGMEMPFGEHPEFFRLSVGDLDSDSDGVTDAEEAFLGSDPLQADSTGRPLPQDLDGDGTTDRTLSGDYAFFAGRYANNSELNDGGPGETSLSPREASRFLMQTTFGPRKKEIEDLRKIGIEAWIEDQIHNQPISSTGEILELYERDLNGAQALTGLFYTLPDTFNPHILWGSNFGNCFITSAIKGKDQLRQRAAFALSQIFVVSRQNFQLQTKMAGLTSYYDMLAENAFGNYYDLLKKVSRHPMMGLYLSSIGNLPPDPTINRYPDENYAREVMQLFTIGIHEMNNDGTFKLDENGLRTETYDQFDVTEMARVMTGLGRAGGNGGRHLGSNVTSMRMYAARHDFGLKKIINRLDIPPREATAANAEQDLDDALLVLFDHENTPPFVSRALIQFLITDNPSPAYVERIANVFIDDGTGTRGNLEAVWKAIILDREARDVIYADATAEFGRLRDPMIRLMHLARLLRLDRYEYLYWWEARDELTIPIGQVPLNASSVFNFYKPDYQPPGPLFENGLVGGPFEILDTTTAVAFPNYMWQLITQGFVGRRGGNFGYTHRPSYTELLPYVGDNETLLDHINLTLCAGRMRAGTRKLILETIGHPNFADPTDQAVLVQKISLALYGAAISPAASITK